MTTKYFDHQAGFTAVRISVETTSGNCRTISTGTGFFYMASFELPDGVTRFKLLLISNKHVLLGGNGKLRLDLNRQRDDGTPDFGNVRTFEYDGFPNRLIEHPQKDVDLACVDVSDITHTDACVKHIGDPFLTPIDYDRVALGADVLFVGYPNDFYDTINNMPLVRKGTLASMPNIDFKGKGHIVIDAQVFSGSSGSPVFVAWDQKYRLLGVISSTVEGLTPSKAPAVLGLGIVIKQRHVQELVDYSIEQFRSG